MTSIVARASFAVSVPAGWAVRDDPECLTLVGGDDGAFQLSSARKSAGPIDLDELRTFYEPTVPEHGAFEPHEANSFSGFVATFMAGNVLWRKYWLACGNVLVFATYNGAALSWSRDQADVIKILKSLTVARGDHESAT
jgi:hypothetical protein